MMLESNNMKSRRREQTLNFYAGFNKSFGDNLSLDASLAAEQFHTTVWNEWSLYPAFNLNYTPAPGNVWQLSLSSDKSYPTIGQLKMPCPIWAENIQKFMEILI